MLHNISLFVVGMFVVQAASLIAAGGQKPPRWWLATAAVWLATAAVWITAAVVVRRKARREE